MTLRGQESTWRVFDEIFVEKFIGTYYEVKELFYLPEAVPRHTPV